MIVRLSPDSVEGQADELKKETREAAEAVKGLR